MNKRNLSKASLTLLVLILVGLPSIPARGQQPAQPKAPAPPAAAQKKNSNPPAAEPAAPSADKVVLKVGNEQVTQADLDFVISRLSPQVQQAITQQGRRPIGDQYALMIVLSQQAVAHHLDSSPEVRRQLAFQRMQTLAQAEYEALMQETSVTPEEISQYYTGHPEEFDEAQIRQVVIRKKAQDAKEGTPGLSEQAARTRAEEIRKALTAGGDIAKVVTEFSVPNEVSIDSEPRAVRHGQLPENLDKAAFQMKEGELSELVDTPQAIAFLQTLGHHRPELKAVSSEIEQKIRQEKVEATVTELRSKTSVWMDDQYFAAPSPSTAAPTSQAPSNNPPAQQ
jgi:peptidyl-prolyl cis-trans isomerase C